MPHFEWLMEVLFEFCVNCVRASPLFASPRKLRLFVPDEEFHAASGRCFYFVVKTRQTQRHVLQVYHQSVPQFLNIVPSCREDNYD